MLAGHDIQVASFCAGTRLVSTHTMNQLPGLITGVGLSDPHEPRIHVKARRNAVILSHSAWKTDTHSVHGTYPHHGYRLFSFGYSFFFFFFFGLN